MDSDPMLTFPVVDASAMGILTVPMWSHHEGSPYSIHIRTVDVLTQPKPVRWSGISRSSVLADWWRAENQKASWLHLARARQGSE